VGSLDPGFLSLGKISGLAGEWVGRIGEERWVGEEGSWSEIHVKLVLKLLIVKKNRRLGKKGDSPESGKKVDSPEMGLGKKNGFGVSKVCVKEFPR
jgi:hypothetical protein